MTQKRRQKSPPGHYATTLSRYIFATKACVDNRKKIVKQQKLLYMSPQYGQLRPTSGWDRFINLERRRQFQRVLCFGTVTAGHSNTGRHRNCGAEQTMPPVFGRAPIMFGIRPHFYFFFGGELITQLGAYSQTVPLFVCLAWTFYWTQKYVFVLACDCILRCIHYILQL